VFDVLDIKPSITDDHNMLSVLFSRTKPSKWVSLSTHEITILLSIKEACKLSGVQISGGHSLSYGFRYSLLQELTIKATIKIKKILNVFIS
jgi:hypothetical protein